jgi:L-threonylcarbamoyladenylate synthase
MIDITDVDEAVRLLGDGEVVAVPTDTVYGIAAALAHPSAVATLFDLKRRPVTVALPVLVDSVEQIERLGVIWTGAARSLASAFWPGALTIVVDVPEQLALRVGSATGTVGFRIPDNADLRNILARSGALAVTSANQHGEAPCESAVQVQHSFSESLRLCGVVDGGVRAATVSTVVQVFGDSWRVVREGAVSFGALAVVLEKGSPPS